MHSAVTSREEILAVSRELIRRQGWPAIHIRSVAAACGVSVGSIYNYFGSKSALVSAAVESIWCEIFHRPEDASVFQDTQACVIWIYERLEYGRRRYPGFFTLHPAGFMKEDLLDGMLRMQQTWQHMTDGLCAVLKRDPRVRPDAFTPEFTAERFAGVLFSLLLSALLQQNYDPTAVLEIVRRTLY